jgi:hypothetical protein
MIFSRRIVLVILAAVSLLLMSCMFPLFALPAGTLKQGTLDVQITYRGDFYVETFDYAPDAENIRHYVLIMPESVAAEADPGWIFTSIDLESDTLSVRPDRPEYAWAFEYLYDAPDAHFVGQLDPGTYAVAAAFVAGPASREDVGAGDDAILWPGVTGGGANTEFQTVTIEAGQTSSLVFAMTDSNGWACPWLYVFDGQTFTRRTEILRNVREQARTEITPLAGLAVVDGTVVIRVAEEKDEVTVIDALVLMVDGVPVPAQGEAAGQVAAADGDALILRQGEMAEFRFPVPPSFSGAASLAVTGYYVAGE